MAGTKFSDYLGLNHYKKAKKIKHFIHLALAYQPQSIFLYNALDLNNQKILWLPSIFQFERKVGFWTTLMSPTLLSPFFVKKHAFEGKKHVFSTKNGLINSGLMSIKQLNKERQPLEGFLDLSL